MRRRFSDTRLNKSSRAIKVGAFFLVPGKVVEAGDLPAFKKKYPDFGRLVDEKSIVEVKMCDVTRNSSEWKNLPVVWTYIKKF